MPGSQWRTECNANGGHFWERRMDVHSKAFLALHRLTNQPLECGVCRESGVLTCFFFGWHVFTRFVGLAAVLR